MKQPIQLDIEEAIRLRDEGMEQATAHADQVEPAWRDIAYGFLMNLKPKGIWQVEDIRKAAEGIVPDPPDGRAWGSVIRRAAKAELVEKVGVQQKAGTICHRGFASLWQFKGMIILIFLISCQKYNATLISWHGYYITDTVTASSMAVAKSMPYDCPGDVRIYGDTVLAYNGSPEEVPTTWREIHPQYMQYVNDPVQISPGVWRRVYFTFLNRN